MGIFFQADALFCLKNMKKIKLTQGKYAMIDNKDYKKINKFRWYYQNAGYKGYATRYSFGKSILMHRVIMNTPTEFITDHKNGNGLDNRRDNLRICTFRENQHNKRLQKNNNSGYKGVSWHKGVKKWHAKIKNNYKDIHLGYFDNKIYAAQSYNLKAQELFGEFARLNKLTCG